MSSINALHTMGTFTLEDDVILLKSGEVLFRPDWMWMASVGISSLDLRSWSRRLRIDWIR